MMYRTVMHNYISLVRYYYVCVLLFFFFFFLLGVSGCTATGGRLQRGSYIIIYCLAYVESLDCQV